MGAGLTEIRCGLRSGHDGDHKASWFREFPLRWWRIYEWPND
jgi:hypothetical protein